MVGKAHGHPFHIIAFVQNIVFEKVFIQFHFSLEESGALSDMIVQDLMPGIVFAGILTLQKDVISMNKALEMGNRTMLFLYHLVGRINKHGLISRIHERRPH